MISQTEESKTILKMNFNFNFKDSLPAPGQSICHLTIPCDWDHTVGIPLRMALPGREAPRHPSAQFAHMLGISQRSLRILGALSG